MATNQQAIAANRAPARQGVRLKTIALPTEHGGWGFLFEPIALGLLLAPLIAGFYLAVSAIGFFLARQPLTLLIVNRQRESPRSMIAKRFTVLYLAVGVAAFTAALMFTQHLFILPLVIAAPLAMIQIAHDWSGRRRVLVAELSGAMAISSLATAIAIAGGWPKLASFAVWGIMMCRAVPAILYVRTTFARLHRQSASVLPVFFSHATALVVVSFFHRSGLAPRLAIAAMLVLLLRALIILTLVKPNRVTARQLGFSEIGFGAATVLAIAFGNAFRV